MQADITFLDEAQTQNFATALKSILNVGDCVFLSGDLGAGKSTFARAYIQAVMAEEQVLEDVPSPSFTLIQTYEFSKFDVHHVDLYRLERADVHELGLEDSRENSVLLIEWPDRLRGEITPTLEIKFTIESDHQRGMCAIWQDQKFTPVIERFRNDAR